MTSIFPSRSPHRRSPLGFAEALGDMIMPVHVALLRAVNLAGKSKLAMSDLRALCEDEGFENVTTYIQSGNVLFSSRLARGKVQAKLEKALALHLGKPVGVHVRTPKELEAIVKQNPFPRAEPNRVLVLFLDRAPSKRELSEVQIPAREELRVASGELFVHYPDGMGRSKLKLPFAKNGTGRNLNTVRKLCEIGRNLEK